MKLSEPAGFEREANARFWRLAAFGTACFILIWAIVGTRMTGFLFGDASAYWRAWHGPLYDAAAPLWVPHFIYSPPVALAFWPLAQMPEDAFVVLWATIGTAAYLWLLAPLPLPARIPAVMAGALFALNGNVEWVLALVAVFGMRSPSLWLVALMTKVTPFVGFVWFVTRRDWSAVAQAAVVTAGLVALSAVLLPEAWPTWWHMLGQFQSQTEQASVGMMMPVAVPLVVRVGIAAVLVGWGAQRDRPAVLGLALALTQPDLQPWAFGCLAATPRLFRAYGSVGTSLRQMPSLDQPVRGLE